MTDVRVGDWDLLATAGDSVPLVLTWVTEAGADYSLVGKAVSLWVGGTVTAPTSFTGATEFVATISTNTASVTIVAPTGSSTPLRVTLDGVLVGMGTLVPSTVGGPASPDYDLTVRVAAVDVAVTVVVP